MVSSLGSRSLHWLFGLVLLTPGLVEAAPADSDPPKITCQINLEALRETRLGKNLVEVTHQITKEELGSSEDALAKITEALGFDPLKEVRSLTIMSDSLEEPEESLQLILGLGKTTGNLEGLMLTAPGYDSHEEGKHTIHSAELDGKRAYATIRGVAGGNKQVLATMSESKLMGLLKSSAKQNAPKEGAILHLSVNELPEQLHREIEPGNPARNVVKLISEFELTVSEVHKEYEIFAAITTTSEKKAAQIQQLAQGAKALLDLLKDQKQADEEFIALMNIVEKIEFSCEGNTFFAKTRIAEDLVLEFLEKEAGLGLLTTEETLVR